MSKTKGKKTAEKPVPSMHRLYKRHKIIIRKMKKTVEGGSDAAMVRHALEFYAASQDL